ncbi:hypothetical protein TSAR_011686 [Trichomalopsis sarcophagae]|uniref:6-bladed beta-propeller n=1 Tax=Trichomalopsis sarcophagae TaxID=543379 RepID=A0A232EKN4_9HYME|nr:hypothetical protein TSAR_011686 [Trichomalopsis sarcophagae]
MSKLNAALIICSCLFFCCADICAAKAAKIVKEWSGVYYTNSESGPKIVKVKDDLLVIGLHHDYTINMTSIDGAEINSFDISGEPVLLGNGKIVVHFSLVRVPKEDDIKLSDLYTIVNPWDCSSIKLVNVDTDFKFRYKAMVPYHDTFDLFYGNSTGELITIENHLDTTSYLKINTIKPYDASEGYISMMPTKNSRMIVLKHLDSDFQMVKESIIGPAFHDFNHRSVVSMTNDSISICLEDTKEYYVSVSRYCTESHYTKNLFCEFYDGKDLNRRAIIQLYETNDKIDIDVLNLPNGDVAALRANYPDDSRAEYHIYRIYKNGTMTEAARVDFPAKYRFMKMVTMKGGEVCLAGKIEPSEESDKVYLYNISVKCIDMFSIR